MIKVIKIILKFEMSAPFSIDFPSYDVANIVLLQSLAAT